MNLTKNQKIWISRIKEQKASGLSQIEYCRKYQLNKGSFSAQKSMLSKSGFLDGRSIGDSGHFLELTKKSNTKITLELESGIKISFDELPEPTWMGKVLGEYHAVKAQ